MTKSPVGTTEGSTVADHKHRRATRLALGIVLVLVVILVLATIAGTSYVATVSEIGLRQSHR